MSTVEQTTRARPAYREVEVDVEVRRLEAVSDGVVTLTLADPNGADLPEWAPGAHIDLLMTPSLVRQYSLCGDTANRAEWQVGVLLDPNSRGGSQFVHDKLHEGSTVRVRGPRNHFPLVGSPRYLFIAGGIGITPMLPMIAAASSAGADWQLLYGGRRRASMAFLGELAHYGKRVTVAPQDETGLLDLDSLLGTPLPDTLVYCCGPEPLLAAVEQRCGAWPHSGSRSLHVERFSARPLTAPVRAEAFEVELNQSELTLTIPPDRSILDVVEEAGVGILSSCAEGTCGTCETTVLDGLPDHRDSVLTEEERRVGDCMMICVSRSCTARLVLDL